MPQFDQGIGYHIHYVRLDTPTTLRMKQEAARLGLPVSEVFRRAIDTYFETLSEHTSPLPERQVSAMPSALPDDSGASPAIDGPSQIDDDDGRFNLLGDSSDDGEQ